MFILCESATINSVFIHRITATGFTQHCKQVEVYCYGRILATQFSMLH